MVKTHPDYLFSNQIQLNIWIRNLEHLNLLQNPNKPDQALEILLNEVKVKNTKV